MLPKAVKSNSSRRFAEEPQKRSCIVSHWCVCLCVCVTVKPLYLPAHTHTHTHTLLPWDKRGHTVNHCWCDDRQQTEGTMHKAAICRGWYKLAPLSHTQTHTLVNPVILIYTNLSFDLKYTVAMAACVSVHDSERWAGRLLRRGRCVGGGFRASVWKTD